MTIVLERTSGGARDTLKGLPCVDRARSVCGVNAGSNGVVSTGFERSIGDGITQLLDAAHEAW